MMASAMIDDPASLSKLVLIREFLRLNGSQHQIDTGSFLHRFAMPGAPSFVGTTATINQAMDGLGKAYQKHRHVWQEEYECHVNWEFTEEELREIVAFLGSAAGGHFLEGRWRMDAYIGTNTEALIEDIIVEARGSFSTEAPSP